MIFTCLGNHRVHQTLNEVYLSVPYNCHYCDHELEFAQKTITRYNERGTEERLEILCDSCYEEWLLSLRE